VLRGLLERTGLDPVRIDDVVLGHCYATSEAPAIGRGRRVERRPASDRARHAGGPRCGSGLQSVLQAAMQVATGAGEVIVAGGVESMSNAPFFSTEMRWGTRGAGVTLHDGLARGRVTAGGRDYPVPGGMLETGGEPAARLRNLPRGTGSARCALAPARGRRAAVRGCSPKRSSRSRSRAEKARPSSTPTSTPAPTPRWKSSAVCGRYWATRTSKLPSLRATQAARTTLPRCAW